MAKAKMLTPEEIAAVLRHVEAESRYPERDRVMVLLSVRAGLRPDPDICLVWHPQYCFKKSARSVPCSFAYPTSYQSAPAFFAVVFFVAISSSFH